MFKRRKPRTPVQLTREFFWPSMGWRRATRYTMHRILRLSDTSHKIAAGLAVGTSVSFTPLVGTHFIQAGLFAYLIRANILAALIGTFTGNPWTFPFMWWGAIEFGSFLFSLFGLPASKSLPDHLDFSILWHIVTNEPLRIFLPWMVGSYTIAVLSWPISYAIFYQLIRGAKAARARAKLNSVRRVAREVTTERPEK